MSIARRRRLSAVRMPGGEGAQKAGDRGHGACENALAGIKDGAPSGPLSGEHGDGTRPVGHFEKLGAQTSNLRTSRPRKASKAMLSGLGTGVRVRSRGKRIYRWRREKSACPRASYGSEKNSPMCDLQMVSEHGAPPWSQAGGGVGYASGHTSDVTAVTV